jgi:hypothetical protein
MNIFEVLDKHKLGWRQKYFEAFVAVQDEAYNTSGVESRIRKAFRPIEANHDGLVSSSTWTEEDPFKLTHGIGSERCQSWFLTCKCWITRSSVCALRLHS